MIENGEVMMKFREELYTLSAKYEVFFSLIWNKTNEVIPLLGNFSSSNEDQLTLFMKIFILTKEHYIEKYELIEFRDYSDQLYGFTN